tara:strand:- start:3411 stop:4049 length:639 start_codon:yes stop_codon:yes gene_type:complete
MVRKIIDYKHLKESNPSDHPNIPLTETERSMEFYPSGVLPSGESAYFDNSQLHSPWQPFGISGINTPYPYPNRDPSLGPITADEYVYTSGAISSKTHPTMFDAEWWDSSGIIKTYPADIVGYTNGNPAMNVDESGIFHWNSELREGVQQPSAPKDPILKGSLFSNGELSKAGQIEDFKIFNPYVHHYRVNNNLIRIPYVSTFDVSLDWNAYG